VIIWKSDVDKPAAEALADDLVAAITAVPQAPGNEQALHNAIVRALTDAQPAAPTGSRTPDRSRLQGPSSARATDDDIVSAKFRVVPEPTWFVVLDMRPEDVVLPEAG
jgi:hypothetical protein